MRELFLDFETTDVKQGKKKRNPSPYLPENYLVSFGYRTKGFKEDEHGYAFFKHDAFDGSGVDATGRLRRLLDEAEVLIAFNAKFELSWLYEAGFEFNGTVRDPMITEYVLLRGTKAPLDLASCCIRRGTTLKKKHLVDELWEQGLGFHEMPMEVVEEYGMGDIDALVELDNFHTDFLQIEENKGLVPTIKMSWDFIQCLVEMERNGIHINRDSVEDVRQQFTKQYRELRADLEGIAQSVMGDTPTNLDSPEQLSQLIYSRKVKDKKKWAEVFNIGTNEKGKRLKPPRMKDWEFINHVREHTEVVKRTFAEHCVACAGKGRMVDKITKNGKRFKNPPRCRDCGGIGIIYKDAGKIAGLRVSPKDPFDTSAGGFATDKETLTAITGRVKVGSEAHEFCTKLIRYNAIGTYLDTFVDGISRGIGQDGLLHTQLMQAITATGRLSSQQPNFQNMPRAKTFPVRRVVQSRWEGGEILEVDFCIHPNTKILTSDLLWKQASDIKVGEELIGFNEKFKTHRDITLRGSVVEKIKKLQKSCVRITTTRGQVVCSKDHFWVARKNKQSANWYSSDQLCVGDTICYYATPWEEDKSWDGGWMAGFLDGEGYLSETKCSFGQNKSGDNKLVLDTAVRIAEQRGFNLSYYDSISSNVRRCTPNGEQQGVRMVGMFRPVRLLQKSRKMWEGRSTFGKNTTPATIIGIEDLGEQEVVAIQTSTKTFIAEGMLSHNCQLEFRVAAYLAQDKQAIKDIADKVDVHKFTSKVLSDAGQVTDRQDAKPHTFKPLYGGSTGTTAEQEYYKAFKDKYPDIRDWQNKNIEEVLKTGRLALPSGREYEFPGTRRTYYGYVTNSTQICNYPVQGFATADIVPVSIILLLKEIRRANLLSKLILTVHDSIVIDVFPGEHDRVLALIDYCFRELVGELERRYAITLNVPMGWEIKAGPDWLNMKEVFKGGHV